MSNSYWDDIDVKVDDACPIATSDIAVNLKNRQKAIDTAGYGPLNPTKPNNEFWDAKAERWNVTADDARGQKCGNCAAFIQTKRMLDCIDKGLGNESGNAAWDVIDAGDLGYCEAFDFKCASSRTCDTWIVGGPITEEKENNMEEKSLEDMYLELLAIEEKSFEEKSLEDAYLELLAIEEKVAPIVPVRPDTERLRPIPEKRFGKPYRPGRGAGLRNMPWYKAEEEYEPEDDMLYDEDYMGDEEDDKAIMKPMSGGGGANNPGSPRDASDRQRGQQFMNWASGRSPSGDNVHPTSVGNMDIGDSGRRNVANSRMTDLMRNRSWTNPRPRPGVGSRATAINTGPPARPNNIQPAPLPTQNYKPKDKPKDWGSDNAAQQISGGIPIKSAWDEEAYYDYDFDMKKLPTGPKPTGGSPGDAAARQQFRQFGDHLNAEDVGGPGKASVASSRQAGLRKYVGDVAIGAAGSASGSPVGDNRGVARPKQYLARVGKNPGSPTAAAERQASSRAAGSPQAAYERQKRATTYGPTGGAQPTPSGRRAANTGRPKPANPGSPTAAAERQKRATTYGPTGGARPTPGKSSGAAFGDYLRGNDLGQSKGRSAAVGRRGASIRQAAYDIAGSEGPKRGPSSVERPRQQMPQTFNQAMRRQNKPSQSLLGENFSKSYDQGYEYDEYDEYIDAKGLTDQQAAGLRAAGNFYSGRNVDGSSFGSADTMASRGKVRRSATLNNFGSEGPKRRTSPGPAPRPVRGPGNPGRMNNAPRPGNLNNKPSSSGGGGLFYGESLGSRWDRWTGKGSDSEMYMDDDDEMAIPPDTNDKAGGSPGDAAARQQFRQFGDHLNAMDIADGPQRAAESAKRKAGLGKVVAGYSSAMGTAQTYGGNRSTSKPRPAMSNKPNRPIASGSGTRRTGSADSIARRNTPAKPASSSGGSGSRSVVDKFGYAAGKLVNTFNPWADR